MIKFTNCDRPFHKDAKEEQYEISWKDFIEKFLRAKSRNLSITREQYAALSSKEKLAIKTSGSFIGGVFKDDALLKEDGSQRRSAIDKMSLIILDAEAKEVSNKEAEVSFLNTLKSELKDVCYAYYKTVFYSDSAPMYRIIIPLATPVEFKQHEEIGTNILKVLKRSKETKGFTLDAYAANHMAYWPVVFSDSTLEDILVVKLDGKLMNSEAV